MFIRINGAAKPNSQCQCIAGPAIDFYCIAVAKANKFGIKNAFLQIADNNFLQFHIKRVHKIFHQVMRQWPAWLHVFQCHGNGLGLKTTNYNGQAS